MLHKDPSTITEGVLYFPIMDEPQLTTQPVSFIMTDDMKDDIQPGDSVSNKGSRKTRTQNSVGGKSTASTSSSVRLKTEDDVAALMARQKLLKDKHELEEAEERPRKRKEQLQLDEEIAAHTAKLYAISEHPKWKKTITRQF